MRCQLNIENTRVESSPGTNLKDITAWEKERRFMTRSNYFESKKLHFIAAHKLINPKAGQGRKLLWRVGKLAFC